MMLKDFRTQGYRSIKDVWLKLKPVNVIIGPNGCGKSNLYKAIYLISCAASGQLTSALAHEGGTRSALWAGARSKYEKGKPKISLSVRLEDFEYNLELAPCGEDVRPGSFEDDPYIVSEKVFFTSKGSKHNLLDRRLMSVFVRNAQGKMVEYSGSVPINESVLSALKDPVNFPQLFILRDMFLSWRFYHDFRTDVDSPIRKPQVGFLTPSLSDNGHDLAAALTTIREVGDQDALLDTIEEAFPGACLGGYNARGYFHLTMSFADNPERFYEAWELSDGTLQFLCITAALLSSNPAPLIALNEPETSLNPGLMEPLAKLIVRASKNSQIWLPTHSRELADYILDMSGYEELELKKVNGETRLVGVGLGGDKYDDDDVEGED